MSIKIMSRVWDEPESLEPIARFVLLKLADHACDDGNFCWPKIETIAKATNLSPRTVVRKINELETAGYLRRQIRQSQSTVYHLSVPPGGCHSDTPGVTLCQGGGDSLSPHHNKGTIKGTVSLNTPPPPAALLEIPSTVDLLYDLYPRKASRPQALKAIRSALKRASFETIKAGLTRWSEHWTRSNTDKTLIPYPATWFNGDRWNDATSSGGLVDRMDPAQHPTQRPDEF